MKHIDHLLACGRGQVIQLTRGARRKDDRLHRLPYIANYRTVPAVNIAAGEPGAEGYIASKRYT